MSGEKFIACLLAILAAVCFACAEPEPPYYPHEHRGQGFFVNKNPRNGGGPNASFEKNMSAGGVNMVQYPLWERQRYAREHGLKVPTK